MEYRTGYMNILYMISSPSSGGAEVYVKDLAKELAEMGHTIHIVFLSTATEINRNSDYERAFLNDLHSHNVSTFILGNECRHKPWLGVLRIRRYIKKHNIEIFHAHLAYGIAFSLLSSVPVVFTHHQSTPRWGKTVYNLFNLKVDQYIGISYSCTESLRKSTKKPTKEIRNAVSHQKFKEFIRVRKPKGTLKIAMVGRIIPYKDYFNMLQALVHIEPSIREKISIYIAGEGESDYLKALEDYIQEKGLESIINFVGVKDNIPEFLYSCDVFLMSSSFEGLPIALIEATMSGLPCIVTDVGGCSEVIKSCQNGVVIPPKDSIALAEAITNYSLNPVLLQKHSENAIKLNYKYSIQLAAKKHLKVYSELLS